MLDNAPWLCCLHRQRPTGKTFALSVLLLVLFMAARMVAVINQPKINETDWLNTRNLTRYSYNDSYEFYGDGVFGYGDNEVEESSNEGDNDGDGDPYAYYYFAPTPLSMYVNAMMAIFYACLILVMGCNRMRGVLCLRPQCRIWLAFLALTYFTASAGYILFAHNIIDGHKANVIVFSALYAYALGFAPAFYLTFRRERAFWLQRTSLSRFRSSFTARHPHTRTERLLEAVANGTYTPSGPSDRSRPLTIGSSSRIPRTPKSAAASVLASDPQLRTALKGMRVIRFHSLAMHEIVGTGGFAEVYRASWLDNSDMLRVADARSSQGWARLLVKQQVKPPVKRQVAVKQLKLLPSEPNVLQAFYKEIALMQQLSHPNVLTLIGVSLAPGGSFAVITEYMPRGSVFHMLHPPPPAKGEPLPRVLAMRMLADCARGVGYLHDMRPPIIHRDLKSPNLLVAPDLSVKVADFGVSRECLHAGAMTRVGSVQWAAPEVLLGQVYSHKCDLWSFGVVIWEVLTAKIPFDGMPQHAVATKVAMEAMRLPVPPNVPLRLLRLMALCWSEADRRPDFGTVEIELQGIENELIAAGEPEAKLDVDGSIVF